jgi:diaminopimelate decarboxylase
MADEGQWMPMLDERVPLDMMAPTARMDRFLKDARPASPCVILDTDVVRSRHEALRKALPKADIFYAVKATYHH